MASNKVPEHDSEWRVCYRCFLFKPWSMFTRDCQWFLWHKAHCKYCERIAKGKRVLPLYVYDSTSQDITKVSDLSNPIVHTITHWNLCSNGAIIVETNIQDAMNGIDKKLKQDDLIYDKTSLVIQGFIGWFLLACFFIMIATAIFY